MTDRVFVPRAELLGVTAATIVLAAATHPRIAMYLAMSTMCTAVVSLGLVLASLATRPVSMTRSDEVELESGMRGRVRAVRWCYTVIDVVNGDTILVPTSVIFAGRLKRV